MKKTISLLIALFLISSVSFSQTISKGKVPKEVKKTFATDYSKAVKPEWSRSDDNYKVEFFVNGIQNSVTYDESGKWLEKKMSISSVKVPKEIKATVSKEFAGFRSSDAEQITKPDNSSQYHLVIKKGKEAYDVYFSAAGEILKKELKTEGQTTNKK
jgi:hypothetical protein